MHRRVLGKENPFFLLNNLKPVFKQKENSKPFLLCKNYGMPQRAYEASSTALALSNSSSLSRWTSIICSLSSFLGTKIPSWYTSIKNKIFTLYSLKYNLTYVTCCNMLKSTKWSYLELNYIADCLKKANTTKLLFSFKSLTSTLCKKFLSNDNDN